MKKIILSIIIFLNANFLAYSHVEHYANFNYLEYELFRNNKSIGYHKYDFIREGEILTVKSEVKFKITKLGVDLYEYFAESDEVYKNNEFYKFSSKTNQNKKRKYVNIGVDPNNKEVSDEYITGIQYDSKDPDDEEPDFSPKHGYWGPKIY